MVTDMVEENEEYKHNVIKQYEYIRKSGLCNMYDYDCVVDLANKLGFYDLAVLGKRKYMLLQEKFKIK